LCRPNFVAGNRRYLDCCTTGLRQANRRRTAKIHEPELSQAGFIGNVAKEMTKVVCFVRRTGCLARDDLCRDALRYIKSAFQLPGHEDADKPSRLPLTESDVKAMVLSRREMKDTVFPLPNMCPK